jgi:hypothetical protein
MSGDRPSEERLRRGTTVETDQSNADNDNPLRGEIKRVIDEGESPQGTKVELESGATVYVRRVVIDWETESLLTERPLLTTPRGVFVVE